MKTKILILLTAVFCFVCVKSTNAQANDTNVVNSGDNVNVESETQRDVNVDIDNNNHADIDQNVEAIANTGGNVASRNISSNNGSSIQTGDATTNVNMDVAANKNVTAVDVGNECCDGNDTDVVNTGNDLDVNTQSQTDIDVDVDNNNHADVDQDVKAIANTGLNSANRNVGGASITTGDAMVDTDLKVKVNQNSTMVQVGNEECCEGNDTDITNTGDDVDVDTKFERDVDIDVDNDNDADIDQDVKAISNTGLNFAERNISCEEEGNCEEENEEGGGVDINTGSAWVDVDADVKANRNETLISTNHNNHEEECEQEECEQEECEQEECEQEQCEQGMCEQEECEQEECENHEKECCGGNDTDVVNTGDHLDVDVQSETNEDIDVDNDNDLFVKQHVFTLANTGLNFSSRNISEENENEDEIMTGDAWTGADLKVTGNKNSTMIGEFEDEFFNEDFFNQFFGWWN